MGELSRRVSAWQGCPKGIDVKWNRALFVDAEREDSYEAGWLAASAELDLVDPTRSLGSALEGRCRSRKACWNV